MTDINRLGELEIVLLKRGHLPSVFALLREIEGETPNWFHPHSFALSYLESLCERSGRDLYYVLKARDGAVGYGLLRGWDENFEIPSLGVCVHPKQRGAGYGSMFIRFLHAAARARGATRVRLRVHVGNLVAMSLYRRLGYDFDQFPEASSPEHLVVAHRSLAP